MNVALLSHEWLVIGLGLAILIIDLWLPAQAKRKLGYAAAIGISAILVYSLVAVRVGPDQVQFAFGRMYALDHLALFFKSFFLLATLIVLLMSVEFADQIEAGFAEYLVFFLFSLWGLAFSSFSHLFSLVFLFSQ